MAKASTPLTNAAISASLSLAANVELLVVAFSNSAGIGNSATASGASGGPTVTVTTTAANSWVFGVGFDWDRGVARTLGANQTLQDQALPKGGTFWTQSQTNATAASGTAVTINDTAPTNHVWNMTGVEVLG